MMKALGFFEIPSVTAAFAALDIMCKTADVALVTWERKLGGRLVTLIIEGDVAAVIAAIEAAAGKAMKECVHGVIPNPHEEVRRLISLSAGRLKSKEK